MIIVLVPKPINPKPASMKNLLLSCICFCLVATTKAQFEKGQKMIAGQLSFNSLTTQPKTTFIGSTSSNIFTSFSLSRFASPTSIKGFGVTFEYGEHSSNFFSSSVGVFYNCTKLEKLANRFYLTFGGTLAINYSEFKNFDTKHSSVTSIVSLNLGLLYHLNNRFLLSASVVDLASLSYSHGDSKTSNNASTSDTKSKAFNLYTGLSGFDLYNVAFGFRYLLKKK